MKTKDPQKTTPDKSYNVTGRYKSKDVGERSKNQKVPGQGQTIKPNKSFENKERKFCQPDGGDSR